MVKYCESTIRKDKNMFTRIPDKTVVVYESGARAFSAPSDAFDDVSFSVTEANDTVTVKIKADTTPLQYIKLHWYLKEEEKRTEAVRILGDAWERGYGNLEWRGIVHDRCMPWYMLVSNGTDLNRNTSGRKTEGFGVKVRPNSLCYWQYNTCEVTLTMDIRNGGSGVILGNRELTAGEIIFRTYENCSAMEAGTRFCAEMCTDPILPKHKVYGSNNWYYAYGNSSHAEIVNDTKLVAELCKDNANIPYMVIDDGWQKHNCDAPWDKTKDRFPDMAGLAKEMKELGVRPGIWVRYLADGHKESGLPEEWHLSRDKSMLDPSRPEVIEYVKNITKMLTGWGYQLIKHDYTTFDIFGRWGVQMTETMAYDGWSFHDRSRTSAEIVLDLYRAIREAAGEDTVIIGCNTISHLCAGLVELNRTGDDTSGMEWNRTRKMGVNTLAFRMTQNGTFYAADADCVGITGRFPWYYNRQWLKLLSESGAPLFVSCKPDVPTEAEFEDIRAGYAQNSVQADTAVPLDWMENVCPEKWLINGEEVTFDWCGLA